MEKFAVDAGFRLEKLCSHVASQLRRLRLVEWTKNLCKTSIFCIDDAQPERATASSEGRRRLDHLAGAQTKNMACRVAPMFVTDGKPNMQHTEFTEDLRDDGLEPRQPVAARCLDGFSGTVLGVSVLRWQMHQQKHIGPRYSRD